jgi:hypothetical protein
MPDRATTPAPPRRRPGARKGAVEAAWLLLVVVLATLMFLARYEDPRRISSSGDSFWYMRQALVYSGWNVEDATREAAYHVCRDINRSLRDQRQKPTCTGYRTGFPARYVAIFDTRPGYPLFATPFVATLGPWRGMMAATLVLAVGAAALAYLAVWLATGFRLAGVIAVGLLFALPSGFWMTRMLAESAMMLGIFAALLGAMLVWRGRLLGLALLVPGIAWLFTVRSASGMAVTLTLLAAAALTLIARPERVRRKGLLVTIGFAAVTLAAWAVISSVLGLPGLNATIQDLATTHFRNPETPTPYRFLVEQNLEYWPRQIKDVLISPLPLVAALFAFAVLLLRMRPVAWMWVITGLTGIMMQVAHPAGSEWARMMVTVNIPIACALAYAAVVVLGLARRRPAPEPAVPQQPGPAPSPKEMAGTGAR